MSLLWDFIAPPFCVSCQTFGNSICEKCFAKLQFYTEPIPLQLKTNYLDGLYATVHYLSPATELIKKLKYKSSWSLAESIGEMMAVFLPIQEKPTVMTYNPLHKKREWERGFNQAQYLAKELSQRWKIPATNLLQRTKATTPQAELSRDKRLTHLQDAFIYKSGVNIQDQTIAIVDDVSTTGTTLNECAKILKDQGAKKVIGIVFAHGK